MVASSGGGKQSGLDEWRYPQLTDAEREAYVRVKRHGIGPREQARMTGRSPGTLSNLLRRAREKLDEEES